MKIKQWKNIFYNCKCKYNSTTCNSNQKWNIKTCQCERENYSTCKKGYSQNSSTSICEISKYLKSIADTSVIGCDEIRTALDIVSKKNDIYHSNICYEYCFDKFSQ